MSVSRWDPWNDIMSLREAMDQLIRESYVPGRGGRGRNAIPVDVHEEGDTYVVRAQLPGLRPEDVHVRVAGNLVAISGETREAREQPDERQSQGQGRWLMRERMTTRFDRVLTLPTAIQADRADAECEHGVLTLRLPKVQAARARSIPVRSGQGRSDPKSEVPVTGGSQDEAPEREGEFPLVEGDTTPVARPSTTGGLDTGPGAPVHDTVGSVEGRTTPPTDEYVGSVDMIGGVAPSVSAPINRGQVREGMEVVGPRGGHVGSVKEVREHDLLVDRSMQRDVYIPYTAVMQVVGMRTVISVEPDEVDNMGWKAPHLSI